MSDDQPALTDRDVADAEVLRAAVQVPARVEQVGRVLGVSPVQVVERLVEDGDSAVSISAMLAADKVARLLEGVPPRRSFRAIEPMILQAFERARGSEDVWRPMTIAVLKNRLIDAIGPEFHEADYGAPNVRAFVRLFPTLLRPIDNGSTPMVELIDPTAAPTDADLPGSPRRIRPDLWRASLDYASGLQFVWDPAAGTARPAAADDSSCPVFPTLDRSDVAGWRAAFAPTVEDAPDGPVHQWAVEGRGKTIELPVEHRAAWNQFQTEHVASHIRAFLDANDAADVPVFEVTPKPQSRSESPLRAYLHRYIDAATEAELSSMTINPAVALRLVR